MKLENYEVMSGLTNSGIEGISSHLSDHIYLYLTVNRLMTRLSAWEFPAYGCPELILTFKQRLHNGSVSKDCHPKRTRFASLFALFGGERPRPLR